MTWPCPISRLVYQNQAVLGLGNFKADIAFYPTSGKDLVPFPEFTSKWFWDNSTADATDQPGIDHAVVAN